MPDATATAPASTAATNRVAAPQPPKRSASIKVTSTSFQDGAAIPRDYAFTACGGKNVSPQLAWADFPTETKSFAITVFDPDAPTGSGYWHWVAFDIPRTVTSLKEGDGGSERPAGGTGGYTDFALHSYGGPCPPKGDAPHHYHFTVYALDVDKLPGVGPGTTGATLVFSMRGHVLAQGSVVGTFRL